MESFAALVILPGSTEEKMKQEVANQEDHINRLPDEILHLIIHNITDAKSLFNFSLVSKRFASLIPHRGGTITVQLPNTEDLSREFRRSLGRFIKQLRCIRSLHLLLTLNNHNLHAIVEFKPEEPPQIVILSTGEVGVVPAYNLECEIWVVPLIRSLLIDEDVMIETTDSAEEEGFLRMIPDVVFDASLC